MEKGGSMTNIIRFPGYLHPDRKSYYHGCKHYTAFQDLLADLTEIELARLTTWHMKRLGPANWQAVLLKQASGAAA
jgi:hypothetical protein